MSGSPTSNRSHGHGSPTGSSQQEVEMPAHKASRFFELARQLYSLGGGTSIELERVVKELSSSSSFAPREARHFYFLAKVFKQSLDYASAIYALRYVLRIDPNHLAARKHLAELLMKHGQEKMSDAVLAQNRGLPAKHYEQSYNTARVYFDECLMLQKSNSRAWMFKGVCHVNLRESSDAIEALARSIHLLTIDVRVYVPWTDKRFENDSKGKTNRQISQLRRQREADKNRHERNMRMLCEMHVLRGKLYWAAGMTEQGNRDLRLASTLQAEHPEVLAFGAQSFRKAEKMYNQALECLKELNVDEALKLVNMALEISAEDIRLHILLSKIQRLLKNLPASYSAIQRATELFTTKSKNSAQDPFTLKLPEDITQQTNLVFNDMAILCAGQGEYEKSIALLNKVIASEKKIARGLSDINFRFYVNRGDCYRAMHELQQAAADYLLALQQHPPEDDVWAIKTRISLTYYLLATDYFNANEFAPADAALTQAIANNPKVAAYYGTRGTCRYYLGAYGEAFDDYIHCLELDPGNEEVRTKLQHQYEKSREESVEGGGGLMFDGTADAAAAPQSAPSGGIIDRKREVVEAMAKLKVTSSDVVDMMLHPRKSHNLPDIQKLVKSASNAVLHAHTAAITATPQPLPVVNPRLTTAFLASQDAVEARQKMERVLKTKYNTEKGALWTTLDNAKKMALARCRPAAQPQSEAEKQLRKTGKEKSYTAAGLKRYSEEMSKAAMLKYKDDLSFIAGVITSYDDPFLLAGGNQPKKVNLIIKVGGANGEQRKFKSAADTGTCDVIETEDSQLGTNLFDAERAAWRKLRAQGDGASVTDELIEQLTRPPPPRPPSSDPDASTTLTSARLDATSDSDSQVLAASRRYAAVQQPKESFGTNKKTANKFGSRSIGRGGGGGGGGGGVGRLGLRVRFSPRQSGAEADESSAGQGEGEGGDGGFFDGSLGVSRVAQLLAEHESIEQHIDADAFGLVYQDDQQSALLSLTEEEELQIAAEARAKAALAEERRKRDLRRAEMRKRLVAQGVDISPSSSPRSVGSK